MLMIFESKRMKKIYEILKRNETESWGLAKKKKSFGWTYYNYVLRGQWKTSQKCIPRYLVKKKWLKHVLVNQ